jgi:uncharacterized NAD(P)/FAD-binding protein YdhS
LNFVKSGGAEDKPDRQFRGQMGGRNFGMVIAKKLVPMARKLASSLSTAADSNDGSHQAPENSRTRILAVIGGGPSALFLLRHVLANVGEFASRFGKIAVFESQNAAGQGMPYSRRFTSEFNLSNISSEELPTLPQSFAEWLESQDDDRLRELHVERPVSRDKIYPRVALGDYFNAQFTELVKALEEHGISVDVRCDSEVTDIVPDGRSDFEVVTHSGIRKRCDGVVIATGHVWERDEDRVNYASPWPIGKLLPAAGKYHSFPIGLLGSSLSAVDVINVLAHHHGRFQDSDGKLSYEPFPDAEGFRIVMHSADGLLSHLQFEQEQPKRELYRHCTEDDIMRLKDDRGHVRLAAYFDEICRPVLVEALREDGHHEEAENLKSSSCSFSDFTEMMKRKHLSPDPFEKMKSEFSVERRKILKDRPTRWKEVLDDLMYTLNFHSRLMPADDHLLLRSSILPFVMNVMAALPLESAKLLIAVHDAGLLDLVAGKAEIDHKKGEPIVRVEVEGEDREKSESREYRMFVNCAGQAPVDKSSFPFPSLVQAGLVTPAVAEIIADDSDTLKDTEVMSRNGKRVVELGGVAVTDDHRLVAENGKASSHLYDIAVPHAAGLRPYCYGLQACDEAAGIVIESLCRNVRSQPD